MGQRSNLRAVQRLLDRFLGDKSGMTSIETAVMFGVIAVSFALLATPLIRNTEQKTALNGGFMGQDVDTMVTGSISRAPQYIIRKSVLLPKKTSQCIIYGDGQKLGDC